MNRALSMNRKLFIFGIPSVLLGVLVLFMRSSSLVENDTVSLAVTADLLLTVPLVYFLLIRKTEIPGITVIPVMAVGLLAGSLFLPEESQGYLVLFKTWALPVIEVSVLTFLTIKVRAAVKTFKRLKGASPDFYSTLRSTCYEILPGRLVMPLVTEIAVLYYGFVVWRTRTLRENEFSYHKKSGTPSLLAGLILIIGIETPALHLLLLRWSPVAAWILTGLGIYTAIQLLGIAKSFSRRPVSLDPGHLALRYGIMNEARIPYADIESVNGSGKATGKNEPAGSLSPFRRLENHNVVIKLKKECTMTGLYGIRKKFRVIGLHLDEAEEFIEKLDSALVEG